MTLPQRSVIFPIAARTTGQSHPTDALCFDPKSSKAVIPIGLPSIGYGPVISLGPEPTCQPVDTDTLVSNYRNNEPTKRGYLFLDGVEHPAAGYAGEALAPDLAEFDAGTGAEIAHRRRRQHLAGLRRGQYAAADLDHRAAE